MSANIINACTGRDRVITISVPDRVVLGPVPPSLVPVALRGFAFMVALRDPMTGLFVGFADRETINAPITTLDSDPEVA